MVVSVKEIHFLCTLQEVPKKPNGHKSMLNTLIRWNHKNLNTWPVAKSF